MDNHHTNSAALRIYIQDQTEHNQISSKRIVFVLHARKNLHHRKESQTVCNNNKTIVGIGVK